MNVMEHARELIRALGQRMGIADLDFDEEGAVVFEIDTSLRLAMGVEPDTDAITLYSPINGSDGKCHAGMLNDMLAGNYLWQATQGATLAIDKATDLVVLQQRVPLGRMSYEDFEKTLETFVTTLQSFIQIAAEGNPEADVAASTLPQNADGIPGAIRV